ncbi:hypothetical protein LguiB_025557 [Lonicera macranthoides]
MSTLKSGAFEKKDAGNVARQIGLHQTEEWGENNFFSSGQFSFYQDDRAEERFILYDQEREQLFPHFGSLDLYLDVVSPPFQFSQEEITRLASIEPQKAKTYTPLASFGMLKNYKRKFSQFNGEKIKALGFDTTSTMRGRNLSNEAIIRLARENFIRSRSQGIDDISPLSHPFACSFLGLSNEEARDVELIRYLLETADKVGQQQFDGARKLIKCCYELSSNKGNAVQRLVSYFSEAIQERIDRETGKITSRDLGKKESFDLEEALMIPSLSILSYYQKLPLSPVLHFTEMQVLVENVIGAQKVHIIDFAIRSGLQYTVLMQALSTQCKCPLECLKITAVGTKSKPIIEKTGKRLMSFAESLNLPFSFSVVMVNDMRDLDKELFELDSEEVIAVYTPNLLSTMIAQPNRLECVMRVIKSINPCVMVVSEEEVNHNSPVFVNRLTEALFFYGAFFDSLEDSMDRDDPHRMILESQYFSPGIMNIVAAEGEERTNRHASIDVWREFFARFGMVEIAVSTLSLFQASLLVNEFACGGSCTLDLNGNCLIVGWKGTPIFCLSTWKFHLEKD